MRPRRWQVVVAMLLTGTLVGACGAGDGGTRAAGPDDDATRPTQTPTAPPAQQATRAAGNVLPEQPERVSLPSGRHVPVAPATTAPDGRLAVPDDPSVAGWWDGGSRPGDPFGATVVAAHVDSVERGLGPFAELLSAGRGDRIVVTSAGLRTDYTITSSQLVPKDTLRTDGSFFAATGEPRLVLITCAGPYDRARGGYQNLAILTAAPDGPTHEKGTP